MRGDTATVSPGEAEPRYEEGFVGDVVRADLLFCGRPLGERAGGGGSRR